MQSYVPLVALGAAGTLMDELTCAVPLLKYCTTGAQYAAICIRKWKACSMPGACLQVLHTDTHSSRYLCAKLGVCRLYEVHEVPASA